MGLLNKDKFVEQARQAEAEAEKRRVSFKSEIVIDGVTYPEWKTKESVDKDTNVIRFGPPYGDGEDICVHYQEHNFKVGDDFARFLCPKTLGNDEACPCCDAQYELFKSSQNSGSKPDRARADDMRARYYAAFAVLDKAAMTREDGTPNWQVFKVGAGPSGQGRQTTFGKIVGKFDRYDDLSHPKSGRWIRVVYKMGVAPGTTQKSRRFGDYDFEPLDPPKPLPKGWEMNLPNLQMLLDPERVPTPEQILEFMGMGEKAVGQGEPWGGGQAAFGAEEEPPQGTEETRGGEEGEPGFSFAGAEEEKPPVQAAATPTGFRPVSKPAGKAAASVSRGKVAPGKRR